MSDAHRPLRTFGRIKSRTIKPRQAALMTTLLPGIGLPDGPFDPRVLMPGAAEVWLEVGFGGGEHLAAQAGRRPDALMIGAEPFLNGVASALRHIEEQGLTNVRLHAGDGRDVMAQLPDASLDRLVVLFPDPWPKARHHKRRLVQTAFVAEAARLLKPGGRFRFATDWAATTPGADPAPDAPRPAVPSAGQRTSPTASAHPPPADPVTTRYELKRLGDCEPIWLRSSSGSSQQTSRGLASSP